LRTVAAAPNPAESTPEPPIIGSIRPGWLHPKEDHRPLAEGAFAPQLKYFTIEAEMLPGRLASPAAGPAPWKVAAEADVEAPFQVGPKPLEGGG